MQPHCFFNGGATYLRSFRLFLHLLFPWDTAASAAKAAAAAASPAAAARNTPASPLRPSPDRCEKLVLVLDALTSLRVSHSVLFGRAASNQCEGRPDSSREERTELAGDTRELFFCKREGN